MAATPTALPLAAPGVRPLSWAWIRPPSRRAPTRATSTSAPWPPGRKPLCACVPDSGGFWEETADVPPSLGRGAPLPGRPREPRAHPSCSVPPQRPQLGATWDAGLPPNPDRLSRGRGPSGRGCPRTYSPTPRREAKVLLGLGVGMAAEPAQDEEGRWEREGAMLVVELVLVGDDVMLVWQLAVVQVAEDPGETEEEDEDEDVEARQVGSEAEEEGEAEEEEEEEEDEEEEDEEEEEEEDRREEAWEESQNEREAQEPQEKQEGEERPEARPGPPPSPLQALEALQSELEPMNKDASRAYSGLKLRFCQRRRRHLDHRSALIRGIPGFWAKAVSLIPSRRDPDVAGLARETPVAGGLRCGGLAHASVITTVSNPCFRVGVPGGAAGCPRCAGEGAVGGQGCHRGFPAFCVSAQQGIT